MQATEIKPDKMKSAGFFRLILIPFFLISIFGQFYTTNFDLAFLLDNTEAAALSRKSGVSNSVEISDAIRKSALMIPEARNGFKVEVTEGKEKPALGNSESKDKSDSKTSDSGSKFNVKATGSLMAFVIRLGTIVLLYFWMRPLLIYLRKNDAALHDQAERRYNNFYRAVFGYLLLTHVIWFLTTTVQQLNPGMFWKGMIHHAVWLMIECYLFYLYLEPTLFLYVSNYFSSFGSTSAGRTTLSIHGKLLTMLFFLVLVPMAILAAYIHFDYLVLQDYQLNALLLLATSAAFLIGNTQLLYKSIQEPLNFLVEKMHNLAEGNFDVKTSVLFDDEIGQLKVNFNLMVEQLKEREELRNTFGKYVSIEIAKHLIDSKMVDLGGESINATILFSDIRNFTSMSENMTPEEVVSMLNTYFSYITDPIMENHGVINKFIGDAVMAIFTPHLGSTNHVEDAINASIGMRERLRELNQSGALKFPIGFGVGLNSGPLVAGNIGTEKRFEYTVIGDTVNVASRMESLTKELGAEIILSENTVDLLDHEFMKTLAIEKSEPVRIKGKEQPMPVYKLL